MILTVSIPVVIALFSGFCFQSSSVTCAVLSDTTNASEPSGNVLQHFKLLEDGNALPFVWQSAELPDNLWEKKQINITVTIESQKEADGPFLVGLTTDLRNEHELGDRTQNASKAERPLTFTVTRGQESGVQFYVFSFQNETVEELVNLEYKTDMRLEKDSNTVLFIFDQIQDRNYTGNILLNDVNIDNEIHGDFSSGEFVYVSGFVGEVLNFNVVSID